MNQYSLLMQVNSVANDVVAAGVVRDDTNVKLVAGILMFFVAGFLMAFAALVAGRFIRPKQPHPEKAAAYECGEPAIGDSWVQFDLRFYVVALVFIIFDVEIALFWPWAVIFGGGGNPANLEQVRIVALYDMLFFFGVIVVGFLYLWRFGYLDWVRASMGQRFDLMEEERSRQGVESSNLGLADGRA